MKMLSLFHDSLEESKIIYTFARAEEIIHANSFSSDTEERTTYFKSLITGSDMTKVTRYESEGMIFKLNGPDKSISIGLNCE